jgi:uncharacterized MnhB-related membrane protein
VTAVLVFDIGLCLLLLGVALAAVVGRHLFGAIVFFIAYGLLVAVAWVRLESVNVALAEAAIGAGLTGALLVGTWGRLRRSEDLEAPADAAADPLPKALHRVFSGVLCLAFTGLLAWAVVALPAAAPGLVPAVEAEIARTGVTNRVTAVLLAFRAWDTLLESVIIAVALVAVWALTPAGAWGRPPGLRQRVRPDGVLSLFGRLLPPAGLVVAVYLVWAGSTLPGGAFQAGTILGAVILLTAMAGLVEPRPATDPGIRAGLVAGPLVFLGVGIAGAFLGTFLGLPEAWSKTLIVTIEVALTGSIALTLAYMVLGVARDAAPGGTRG